MILVGLISFQLYGEFGAESGGLGTAKHLIGWPWVAATMIGALVLTLLPWSPEKKEHVHPEAREFHVE